MSTTWANDCAFQLRMAIEMNHQEAEIGSRSQDLVRALGGGHDISQMTPGAAALYILALVLERPTEG
jgi:hypothetical protein